jgi:tetratricopeptide (TPR) repeat protein
LKAIELFEGLLDRHPGDPQAIQDLALAYHDLGTTYADDHRWQEANQFLESAIDLYNKYLELQPDSFPDLVNLAECEVEAGESRQFVGRNDQSEDLLLAGYHRIKQARQFDSQNRQSREVHGMACRELGKYYQAAERFNTAEEYFNEYLAVSKSLAEEFPLDYGTSMDYSTAWEYSGRLYMRLGRYDQAIQQFEQSLAWCIALGKAAPNNDQVQWDVTFSYQALADAYLAAGVLDKAEANALIGIEMRRRLVKNGPEIAIRSIKLNHMLKTLARVYQRQQRYEEAMACYAEAVTVCKEFDQLTGSNQFEQELAILQANISKLEKAQPSVE